MFSPVGRIEFGEIETQLTSIFYTFSLFCCLSDLTDTYNNRRIWFEIAPLSLFTKHYPQHVNKQPSGADFVIRSAKGSADNKEFEHRLK